MIDMNNTVFELNIKNDSRIIPEIAKFVSDSAFKLGLSNKKSYYLCFTIETVLELRTKAISEDNPEIKIKVEDDGTYFTFSVTDLGSPYILSDNQRNILKRKLVDRYSFEQSGRKGQTFSFGFKYDKPQNIEFETKQEELLDEDFSFRRVKNEDEDILRVINCLYATYGYDYYHQHLYSVENFKKYMSSGRYVPIIGENKHDQAMSYCALDENVWFLGVPEFSNLVTSPIARGKGVATKIFKETEKIAEDLNYEGIHVSAVAYHPYTQKMCNKLGYVPCAIEYSINPKGTGGYDDTRRLDCVIGVKVFDKNRKHDLYLEKECNEMYSSIFDELNLNYEIHNEVNDNTEESILTYVVDTDTSNAFVKIDECSKDIYEELSKLINNDEVKEMDVITVNLNMNHPSSIKGYKVLRELGFISVGTIPGGLNGDFMLLQKFKVEPEYEKIVTEPNYYELVKKLYKLNGIEVK